MKPLSLPGRIMLVVPLAFMLPACDTRKPAAQSQAAESKTAERDTPPESAEHRRVREMLEGVTIPVVDFERTTAETGADYVAIRVKKIAPTKTVDILVRRPMPAHWNGKPRMGQVCYSGHTWRAENISAWQVLERIANDNGMSVEVDEKGVRLMPLPVDGKPVPLRPLEEEMSELRRAGKLEPWPDPAERGEEAGSNPPLGDGAGFVLPE